MNKNLTFYGGLWILLLAFTITSFNWWLFSITLITCPLWKDIRDWFDWFISQDRRDAKKIEKAVMDEINKQNG